jgi:hypothetical protein
MVGHITSIVGERTQMVGHIIEVVGESTEMVGHITDIVGESTQMVGHITEIVGEMTQIESILITSSRQSFSVNQQLQASVDCICRKELNRGYQNCGFCCYHQLLHAVHLIECLCRAAVRRSFYDLATTHFFGKCTQECVRDFITHLKNWHVTKFFKKQNITRRPSNLANFELRQKSQNDETSKTLTSRPLILGMKF